MEGIRFSGPQAQSTQAGVKSTAAAVVRPSETDTAEDRTDLREMLREAREKAEERRDSLKLHTNPARYGDTAMTAYAKLARARSQGEVSAAAGYARRQIVRLRAALNSDSDNAPRIKGAIRQLEKAVGRAGRKKQELRREDLIRARQRKAQAEQARRKAAGLGQELQRRRALRVIRESGYLREAEIEDRQQAQIAKTNLELRQQVQDLGAAPPSPEGAALGYAAAMAQPAPAGTVDFLA